MAPKKGAGPPRKKAKGARGDWRTPLFYWRGRILSDERSWQGTWVASEAGLPSDEEFAASKNTFKLTCDEAIGMLVMMQVPGNFTGSYLLDQGDGKGLQSYSDVSHTIQLLEAEDWCVAAARGSTEFGEFVSLGSLDRDDEGTVLTLARRYIGNDDTRTKMTVSKVVSSFGDGGANVEQRAAPWEALPWRLSE